MDLVSKLLATVWWDGFMHGAVAATVVFVLIGFVRKR